MSSFSEKIFDYYKITKEGFARLTAEPSFLDIPTLENDDGAKRILARLTKARENNERLIIYGDYDTDGVMATSIMKKALDEFGLPPRTFLPSRYQDGYGLNLKNAEKIVKSGYNLVLLVDNGVSAFEGVQYLNEHNVDVLIIDHHEITKEPPTNAGLVHPVASLYPEPTVSAGYLSFIFSRMLLGRDDPYLMFLGALSTLSDMMPLKEHNRSIVRLAIKTLNENKYPQVFFFLQKEEVNADDLQMAFIPAINAIGRMESGVSINRLVNYFAEQFSPKSEQIAMWMKTVNEERKRLTKEIVDTIQIDESSPSITILVDEPEGINGLLANRLLRSYKKPACLFSRKEGYPSILVGSLRSQNGFNVIELFEKLRPYLIAGGGHALAGGLTIKTDDFETVKKEIDFFALKHKFEDDEDSPIEISLDDLTLENLDIIESLAPYGEGWKEPKFLLPELDASKITFSQDGRFISWKFGMNAKVFSFALGTKEIAPFATVSLLGKLRANVYRGHKDVEFLAESLLS